MRLIPFATLAVCVSVALPSYASTGYVITESVDSYAPCNLSPDLQNSNVDANGFAQTVTSGGLFTLLYQHQDSSVWDGDFYDYDVTNAPLDNDTLGFDPSNNFVTISFYAGHGSGAAASVPTIACEHDSDCGATPAQRIGPGVCQTFPGSSAQNGSNGSVPGLCRWGFPNALVVCGANDTHGHWIAYGDPGGPGAGGVAWGESTTQASPGWANAGTNGGVNLVALNSSYGTTAGFWAQTLIPAMAGVHILAVNMVVDGDTSIDQDNGDLGPAFGSLAAANPGGSVAAAWTDGAMTALAGTYGAGSVGVGTCNGLGYNGCGCNLALSADTTAELANWHIQFETWADLLDDANDSGGNTAYSGRMFCNYDANNYAFDVDAPDPNVAVDTVEAGVKNEQ